MTRFLQVVRKARYVNRACRRSPGGLGAETASVVMTNTSKEEILEKHLPYEIDMMRETYRLLGKIPPPENVIKNALIESFCIHARSLLDFFERKRKPQNHDDDFFAADFTNSFETRINVPAAVRTKLNKEIFHLTGERRRQTARQTGLARRVQLRRCRPACYPVGSRPRYCECRPMPPRSLSCPEARPRWRCCRPPTGRQRSLDRQIQPGGLRPRRCRPASGPVG
jgi:hypothetical protein